MQKETDESYSGFSVLIMMVFSMELVIHLLLNEDGRTMSPGVGEQEQAPHQQTQMVQ
jgi:hypothetical protein